MKRGGLAGSNIHPPACFLPPRSYLRVFETVKAVNQAAKAKSCSESPLHAPSSKQLLAVPSRGGSTPPAGCCGSEGTQ